MLLIYDTAINRYVGQADFQFDVAQICSTFELREWTQEGQLDFDSYKQELADLNPQPQGEQDGEVTGRNEGVEADGITGAEGIVGSADGVPVSTD